MSALPIYRATLGSYSFEVFPDYGLTSKSRIRDDAATNVRVSLDVEVRLRCRIPASTDALTTVPPAAATDLGTFLGGAVHSRTLPTALTIEDQAGDAIPAIGDMSSSGGWEDLRLVEFELLPVGDAPGQLVAGAYFRLVLQARRSFADSDGICELEQVYEADADEGGREVRRLTSTIRLSRSAYGSGTRITTAAVAEQLRLVKPIGWVRSRGNNANGFAYRYLKASYDGTTVEPGILAETVSEVTQNAGVAGASGATDANVTERRKDDPAKGVVRVTSTADTKGPADALAWVEGQQPSESTGETTSGPGRSAQGEWARLEPISPGASSKITRVRRRYSLSGGARAAGAISMAGGLRAVAVRGAFVPLRLTETFEVQALGVTRLEDVPLPPALEAPWVIDGAAIVDGLPSIDEDARDPSQRLWLRVIERRYVWGGSVSGPLDPAEPGLLAQLMAEAEPTVPRIGAPP